MHEHPVHATSWKEPEVVELMEQDDVYVVEGSMCRWGMKSKDASGVGYVRKPTRWMTNSRVLAVGGDSTKGMSKQGRTCVAQARDACERKSQSGSGISTCTGSGDSQRNKSSNDRRRRDQRSRNVGAVPDEEPDCSEEYFEGWFPEQKDEEDRIYVDDITGVQLPTDKVLEARQEELQWIHKQKIYEKRTLDDGR